MSKNAVLALVIFGLVSMSCGPTLAPAAERDAYLGKVELENVRANKSMTGRWSVYGGVKNAGDRTVTAVVLTIHLLDENGDKVETREGNAVWGDPLEAGSSVEFRIPVDDAPETWDRKVDVEIKELGFGA